MFIEPEINHHFGGGVYAKETIIPAGGKLIQHAHTYDHLSILAKGVVELVVDGESRVVHAPACLTIAAGKHHGVKSLTDTVWYCIHASSVADDDALIAPSNVNEVSKLAQILSKGD